MTEQELSALAITIKVASLTVVISIIPGILLGLWMSRSRSLFKSICENFIILPLLFPPVAIGIILLLLLSRKGPIGSVIYDLFGQDIPLTWQSASIACSIVALPILVESVRSGFSSIDPELENIARTLGANKLKVFMTISLPLAWREILSGLLLTWCRAIGEFGATMVIAGNIPGKTQTLALLMFNLSETGDDTGALRVVGMVAVISLIIIPITIRLRRSSYAPV